MKYTRKGYLVKRGHVFYAVWYVEGNKFSKSTGMTDRKKAGVELARMMAPFVVGNDKRVLETVKARLEGTKAELAALDDENNPPLTLDRAWAAFERSPGRPDSGERTLSQYSSELTRFKAWMVKTHKGPDKDTPDRITMREIPAGIAEEYAQDLTSDKLSPSTFNQHIKFLSMLWRVLDKEIKGQGCNPWNGIARKRINPMASRKRALTAAQFDSLIASAEADPEIRDLIIILAWTGVRLVDAVKLLWGSVDFSRNVITITPQKTARRTGKTVSIPMFPAVKGVLNRRQSGKAMTPGRPVFPGLVEDYDRDEGSALSKRLGDVFEKAGMVTAEKRAGQKRAVVCYGAHSLRHHFVSAASAAGLPDLMIKSITGHSSDTMLEHYQQIGAGLVDEFATRLGGGSAAVKALPPAGSPHLVDAGVVRSIAETMTAKTWKQAQSELLKMTDFPPAAVTAGG